MDDPLDAAQPYSPTFRIANTGLLAMSNVRAYCYANRFEIRTNTFADNMMVNKDWSAAVLEHGEPMTVVCNLLHTDVTPTSFDIALVVEYSPYWIPIYRATRAFRWVGTRTPHGSLRLLPQPIEPIREKAFAAIRRFKENEH